MKRTRSDTWRADILFRKSSLCEKLLKPLVLLDGTLWLYTRLYGKTLILSPSLHCVNKKNKKNLSRFQMMIFTKSTSCLFHIIELKCIKSTYPVNNIFQCEDSKRLSFF